MYQYNDVPDTVRRSVVEGYLKAQFYPVNIWYDTDSLRFHVVKSNGHHHVRMNLIGKFHKIEFADLLDELMFAFQNE